MQGVPSSGSFQVADVVVGEGVGVGDGVGVKVGVGDGVGVTVGVGDGVGVKIGRAHV